jgi:hypothetical protein
MEAIYASNTSVDSEWTTRHYIPEDSTFRNLYCEDLNIHCYSQPITMMYFFLRLTQSASGYLRKSFTTCSVLVIKVQSASAYWFSVLMSNCVIRKNSSGSVDSSWFYYDEFKPGHLHEKHAIATWNLGNISAFV